MGGFVEEDEGAAVVADVELVIAVHFEDVIFWDLEVAGAADHVADGGDGGFAAHTKAVKVAEDGRRDALAEGIDFGWGLGLGDGLGFEEVMEFLKVFDEGELSIHVTRVTIEWGDMACYVALGGKLSDFVCRALSFFGRE